MVIDQVQLGDVTANQSLHVITLTPDGVSQSATTVGNTALGSADNAAVNYQATQRLSGDSHATTNVTLDGSAGSGLYVTSSATGNSGTGGTCCAPLTGSAVQTIDAGHTVTAETYINGQGAQPTGEVYADATAIGNTQGWETKNGAVNASSTQVNNAETYAALGSTMGPVDGAAVYSTTAVANNVTSDATNSPVNLTVTQTSAGPRTRSGQALTQSYGSDITAIATATSNNLTVTADNYAATVTSSQDNATPVQAQIVLTTDSWSGTATTSAYGVANSALVSNSGSYTLANGVQNNTGDVTASVTFYNSGTGSDATQLATAAGNAYSAYACPDCNGVVVGNLRQTNSGGVSAVNTTTVGTPGYIAGAASAVGNNATFQVHKN